MDAVVIGAGKRVRNVIAPALGALVDEITLVDVVANRRKPVNLPSLGLFETNALSTTFLH